MLSRRPEVRYEEVGVVDPRSILGRRVRGESGFVTLGCIVVLSVL